PRSAGRRYNVGVRVLAALLCALVLAPAAAADDVALVRAQERYLPPAQRAFADDPDGFQARYDAGRDLMEALAAAGPASARCARLRAQLAALALAQVRVAEAADRPVRLRPPPVPRVTASCTPTSRRPAVRPWLNVRLPLPAGTRVARPAGPTDHELARRLATIGSRFDGWAGIWVHDLRTGRTAGWNADARFPAASTVKLGALVAALRTRPRPETGRHWYDVRRIGAWSSNLAANRVAREVGYGAVGDGLRRLGMHASTYPGPYRATTSRLDAPKPPPHRSTRVTTARDLGGALYRLHAAAVGNRLAQRRVGLTPHQARLALSVLLAPERAGDNVGLLRPWLGRMLVAEKNGWLSDLRTTASLLYRRGAPLIVVVEAWSPTLRAGAARRLGREVLDALDR
ncbi:MAG TPA: serine hydrolase, partial [Gaiellaceae bacterium]|nr:serine hydrolase [Gaiellaceae bacterium]